MPLPNVLQAPVLQGLMEKHANFANPFARFFDVVPAQSFTPLVEYDVLTHSRQMASIVSRHGVARPLQTEVRTKVAYEPPTYKNTLERTAEAMDALAAGTLTQNGYEQALMRDVRSLARALDRRKAWMMAQFLTFGALLSSAGLAPNTLASIDGTVYYDAAQVKSASPMSVSMGITAAHSDATVAASWATASTDIRSDLEAAALVCELASGIRPTTVLMNSVTFAYIMNATQTAKSNEYKAQWDRQGSTGTWNLWGFDFLRIDARWPVDTETMADTAEDNYYIPTNVVVLIPPDNSDAGRIWYECRCDDMESPVTQRGLYTFINRQTEHPHKTVPGFTYTAGPAIENPDSMYVFRNVTQT